MTALGYYQEQGYRFPRIRGWDVSGDIAHTVATDYRRLVDIFGLEPPEAPFTVYVEPGGGSTYHHYGATTTFFIGTEDPYSAGLTAAVMVDVFAAGGAAAAVNTDTVVAFRAAGASAISCTITNGSSSCGPIAGPSGAIASNALVGFGIVSTVSGLNPSTGNFFRFGVTCK